ncbi:hypothetical protein AB0M97_23685 [Streptomyces sp. NPDC051207]|uniref:SCO2400 family protein n=1 Tax=Streptomyces sp. NPDC051207 TaxID=3154641 RepID=UPI00343D41BC
MDYCSSCRRHLNGALVCPGCGAYAPDIDPAACLPAAPASTVTTAVGAAAGTGPGDFDTWQDSGPGDAGPWQDSGPGDFEVWQDGDPGDEPDDVVAAQPVTEGRAARRRQRARWKKNQRRAVVATAVALVSGSVAMVAMDQQPGDRARAAAAPLDPSHDNAEEPNGQHGGPTTTRPETPRSTPTPPASERTSRHADGPARTAPSISRPDLAAPAPATEVSAPQQRTTTVSSVSDHTESTGTGATDGSGTADTPVPTPTPTPPPANDGAGSPGPGTEEPTTPPATKDPRELCLLVLCVG